MKLEGQAALVTGAGSGIGRAIAILFASEGANIAVNDIDLPSARATAKAVRQIGRKTIAIKANVAEPAEVDAMIERTIRELGGVNILVNNAGIAYPRSPAIEETNFEVWDKVLSVILRGTYICSVRAAKWMASHGAGKIVNISSVAGLSGFSQHGSYGPAKAGIVNLTQYLAVEWAKYKININSIAPGYTRTPLLELGIKLGHLSLKEMTSRTPFGRLAEPEEIARAALFLASDDASFITGATLPVDGGFLAFGV